MSYAAAFRSMAEYLCHNKHTTKTEMANDDEYALTIILGITVKILSLLLLNARIAAAIPHTFQVFKNKAATTTGLTTTVTFLPESQATMNLHILVTVTIMAAILLLA